MNFSSLNVEFDKNIILAGDLHGVWRNINFLIAKHKPSIILQVGDFGWWPKYDNTHKISTDVWRRRHWEDVLAPKKQTKWRLNGLKVNQGKLYFCPGNHEDWIDLERMGTSFDPKPVEVLKNIFYMPRCSTLNLPDGRRVLFIGGAASIDKDQRIPYEDWFPQETITLEDIDALPDTNIDIVVSHTCPIEFREQLNEDSEDWRVSDSYWLEKFRDPSCNYLSRALDKYNPKWWFFGHYHVFKHGKAYDTRWVCLNKTSDTGWWTFMPRR